MPAFIASTWNVENLFRPEEQGGTAEVDRYRRKLSLLATAIGQLGSDVVALQELGGQEPLQDLQRALGGAYPHAIVSRFPDARGIRVGFLSRHPFQETEDLVDLPSDHALQVHELSASGAASAVTRMGRGALRVRVRKDALSIDLLTLHLKSKLLTYPRPGGSGFSPRDEAERVQAAAIALMRRTAEASAVRLRANALLAGQGDTRLIVLGDCNDVPEAQTSLILCGPPGSEIGTRGFDRRDKGDDVRLFNLAPLIPAERRFSRKEGSRSELLDQILVSEELVPLGADKKRRLPSVDSWVDFAGALAVVGEDPAQRSAEIAPDHAPVTATFAL